MYFASHLTETFQQPIGNTQAISEIDMLYHDVISNLDQETQIPTDVISSFKVNQELCPAVFSKGRLNSSIREQLLQISKDFFKDVKLSGKIQIQDIHLVGSLANYNWSKFSDFDLHIILDFKSIGNQELVTDYFKTQRFLWNEIHDIKLHGFPVEIYIQDSSETNHSGGIYSILNNTWLKEPERNHISIDKQTVSTKIHGLFNQLKKIKHHYENQDFNAVLARAEPLRDKIYTYRKAGLEANGETGTENVIFKILRRTSFMDYLNSILIKAYDKATSI